MRNIMYQAIVIGSSAGGLNAVKTVITGLPQEFQTPILIVQHLSPHSDNFMARYLNQLTHLQVKEADEKEPIRPWHVYIAPPNFHLLVEEDYSLSLSVDEKVNYARPSIDVLFETAAVAYGPRLIGLLLTGANNDGTKGFSHIKAAGGTTIAQDPATAESPIMPASAIASGKVDHTVPLNEIAKFLVKICAKP